MIMKSVLLVMAVITISPSVISQSAVSSLLQDLLSPGNSDKAMQFIKMAASRPNYMPGSRTVACEPTPARFARKEYPPARTMVNERDGYARVLASPDMLQNLLRQVPVGAKRTIQPNTVDTLVLPNDIFSSYPVSVPQEGVPCQKVSPYFNPYLPAASPVSSLSPGNMPSPTQSRGQFLRKIPIPPPTL